MAWQAGFAGFFIFVLCQFPPARHRPPYKADSGEAGGEETGKTQSPSTKKTNFTFLLNYGD